VKGDEKSDDARKRDNFKSKNLRAARSTGSRPFVKEVTSFMNTETSHIVQTGKERFLESNAGG
jgi:hypothetical protein